MKISLLKTTFAASLVAVCGIASASAQNLLSNGSFEDLPAGFSFPGSGFVSTSGTNPTGWSNIVNNIYIIKSSSSTFSTIAQDGNVFIGLQSVTGSASGNSGAWAYQDLSGLTVGDNYTVSFYLRARNSVSQTGTLYVQTGKGSFAQNTTIGNTTASQNQWQLVTYSFTATEINSRLSFAFFSDSGDQMVFIDNVSLVKTSTIPEPSTYVLLAGVGMFFVVLSRRLIRRR